MEDRYLFKAKRVDNGEWVIGNLIQNPFFKEVRSWISSEQEDKTRLRSISRTQALWNSIEVDPSTICQCTGLKDKNGKLIWENDILLQKTTEKHWCEWQRMGLVQYGEHDWNEGVYGYKNIGFFVDPIVKEGDETRMKPGLCQEDLVFENYPYEVIGNIFDSPELLEV